MSDVPDPSTWATGQDPMTAKQEGFIQSLAEQKGIDVDTDALDKGSASKKIEELKDASGSSSSGSQGQTSSSSDKKGDALDQDPSDWSTGQEDATQKQRAYIAAMAKKAGEEVNLGSLDKAGASKKIEELKDQTGM